jgi:Fe-S cluster assembly protein SufB
VRNPTFTQEHEASTSCINEDQLFYIRQRGLPTEEAIKLIVGGFCSDVFNKLPMEFAIEANQLLAVSLEGSVG